MSLYALLARLNELNAKDKIIKWNSNVDLKCTLCLQHEDDINHLFFNCPYSSYIWNEFKCKLGIQQINSCNIITIFDLLAHISKAYKRLVSIAITSIIWNIQCKRNSYIFKGIQMPSSLRSNLIYQNCKDIFQIKDINQEEIKGNENIFM